MNRTTATVRRCRAALGLAAVVALLASPSALPATAATASPAGATRVAAATAAAAPLALPGGRPYFVTATLTGGYNARIVKVGTYTFASNGTLTQQYWTWRQDSITGEGNARYTKVPSGYTTQGCAYACPIRTPVGFQHGGNGRTVSGTWARRADGTIAVYVRGIATEVWRERTSATLASLVLVRAAGSRGWALGSTAPLSQAGTIADYYATDRIYGPYAENQYILPTVDKHVGFHSPDFSRCSNGFCLQNRAVGFADKRTWFHSYLATNPAADGRKVFWNVQNGYITQMENPGSICISAKGGGHTYAALQALDDNGRLVALVGVEASINQRARGQDIVAAFAMVPPALSALVEG